MIEKKRFTYCDPFVGLYLSVVISLSDGSDIMEIYEQERKALVLRENQGFPGYL